MVMSSGQCADTRSVLTDVHLITSWRKGEGVWLKPEVVKTHVRPGPDTRPRGFRISLILTGPVIEAVETLSFNETV